MEAKNGLLKVCVLLHGMYRLQYCHFT